MKLPRHIELANLPTKIEKLERFFETEKNIYIKRDDQTGSELSGNKVRKLEFAIQEAMDLGAKTLITCGGIQSNHARATAAAAKKLGLNCILVLRSDEEYKPDGNYFLDILLGAEIRLVSSEDFSDNLANILEDIKKECDAKGENGYILPVGASNGIGTFGYVKAMEEIKSQEDEMGITFDTVVCTVGS
ncbi:MAG: pyridoxal-phosphate dependent enzyme, partial [Tissierellia bacterium]|nr:pyridoxal-phosphate dependent enzyme [Tissierellia bacterium]